MRPSEFAPAPSMLEHSRSSFRDMAVFLDRHRLDCRAAGDAAGANRAAQLLQYVNSGATTVIFGGVKYTLTADGAAQLAADGARQPTDVETGS